MSDTVETLAEWPLEWLHEKRVDALRVQIDAERDVERLEAAMALKTGHEIESHVGGYHCRCGWQVEDPDTLSYTQKVQVNKHVEEEWAKW